MKLCSQSKIKLERFKVVTIFSSRIYLKIFKGRSLKDAIDRRFRGVPYLRKRLNKLMLPTERLKLKDSYEKIYNVGKKT